MTVLVSRKEAVAAGARRFFTGEPCKKGHVAERLVSNSQCVTCYNAYGSEWKKRNRASCTATSRKWNEANREKIRAVKNAWNKANPEGQKARSRKWYEANKGKSFENHYRWAERNPDKVTAAAARRRASLLRATPAWADNEAILAVYREARQIAELTGAEHHVDHIVPLQGKNVCGLHVHYNLQVLQGRINRSKGNRIPEAA